VADHLTDEEQLQTLKNWWKENGTSLIVSVLLGLTAYFGFQGWQNHQQQHSEQASVIYADFLEAFDATRESEASSEEKLSTVNFLAEQLQNDYASSLYAANASLYVAKLAVEDNDLAAAEKALQWVVDNGEGAMQSLASLRLARIFVSQEKYDAALALAVAKEGDTYLSLREEIKGDVYAAKEEWSQARLSYQAAIEALGSTTSFRSRLLPIKLDNLPTEDVK
jgi:predicted negative regulator of RcsB-dependent stress response